jgi:hypothetical protein
MNTQVMLQVDAIDFLKNELRLSFQHIITSEAIAEDALIAATEIL